MVETFEAKEAVGLMEPGVELDAWNALVDALGLDGQKKLVEVPQSGPVPFMYINAALRAQLKILCPREFKLDAYDLTPIPVVILGLVKQAKDAKWFDEMQVWADDKSPDPVLIGIREKAQYLIGRWGAEDHPFEKLREMAKARWIRDTRAMLNLKIEEAKSNLAHIEDKAELQVSGQWVYV